MHVFALATCAGGVWGWLAVGYVTALVFLFDRLAAAQRPNSDPEMEFPAADPLLLALGLAHFAVLILALWGVAGQSGLTLTGRRVLALDTGLVTGQISHS